MRRRVLIPLHRDDVAPRFDVAIEVLLADVDEDGNVLGSKIYFLAGASAEGLCDFILDNDVAAVVTNGIAEEYYHFLRWKRIEVVDGIIGPAEEALRRYLSGDLLPGDVVMSR